MQYYDKRYYTLDKLSKNSLDLIRIRLVEFLSTYNIKDYPINCFELLNRIIHSKTIDLSKMECDSFSNNFDAAAVYFGKDTGYCIMINSNKNGSFKYSRNRRCNFTFAHELAHIFLGHLLISRKLKSKARLNYEDLEADEFAGRLLMPEKLLLKSNFLSRQAVSIEFLVSDQALFKRLNNLKRLDLFNSMPIATCKHCGNSDISKGAEFCIICGAKLTSSTLQGVKKIKYSELTICPVCESEIAGVASGNCKTCGTPLFNICCSNGFLSNCNHNNPSNARFCEVCGNPTIYWKRKLLLHWKEEKSNYIRELTHV